MLKTIFVLITSAFLLTTTATGQKAKTAKAKSKTVKTTVVKKQQPQVSEAELLSDRPLVKAVVLDSIVCGDSDIISNIPLPSHAGILLKAKDGSIVLENEFSDMRLTSKKNTQGYYRIYRTELIGNKWTEPEELKIESSLTDMRSPFLMADGQTLYFSGRDMESQNKTFNIYTSTLDTETGTFKKPAELALPYYSTSDDLYFIADEADSVAWFVTTRHQPHGKVCIYTIHLTQPWQYYETDEMPEEKFMSLARISSIKDTWTSTEKREANLKALRDCLDSYNSKSSVGNNDISATRKALILRQTELKRQLTDENRKMAEFRSIYHKSSPDARKKMTSSIKTMELNLRNLRAHLRSISHELKP